MPEHSEHTAEKILNNIMETLADSVPKQKSVRFFEEENTVSSRMNRLFGRQKSVHMILGGGMECLQMCCCGGTKKSRPVFWEGQRLFGCSLNGLITIF